MRREGRLQASSQRQGRAVALPVASGEPESSRSTRWSRSARKYDVDGIHFDYIRYPDGDHCFCAGCRERFGRAAGVTDRELAQATS